MRRVVITGMGVVSPIGNNIDTFWNSLANGVCGIDFIKSIPAENIPVKIAAEVKDFNLADFGLDPSAARRMDLFAQYALAAAKQAMDDSKIEIEPERLGVYIGSGVGGLKTFVKESDKVATDGAQWVSPLFVPMMISNIAGGNVAIAFNAQGPCLPIVTACATGTNAIGEAFRAIQYGHADAIIAGGTEAGIEPLTIGGFANSKALSKNEDPKNASMPFDKRRNGFVLGEGAGVVILEEYEHAVKRNAKIYAEVRGYGHTCDAHHVTAPKPDGSSASRAMKMALQEAEYTDSDVLYINAHGTSTPLNDKSETLAIKLALGEEQAHKAFVSSNKSMMGHMLGAAGAVELIASVLTLENGIIPPTINLLEPDPDCDLNYVPNKAVKANATIALSNSLGFGGHNACLTIRKIKK